MEAEEVMEGLAVLARPYEVVKIENVSVITFAFSNKKVWSCFVLALTSHR